MKKFICYECEKEMVEKNGVYYCVTPSCSAFEVDYTPEELYEEMVEHYEIVLKIKQDNIKNLYQLLNEVENKYRNTIKGRTLIFIGNLKRKIKEVKSKEFIYHIMFRLKCKLGIAKYKHGCCPNCGSQDYESSVWRTGEDEVGWSCNCNTCGYFTED